VFHAKSWRLFSNRVWKLLGLKQLLAMYTVWFVQTKFLQLLLIVSMKYTHRPHQEFVLRYLLHFTEWQKKTWRISTTCYSLLQAKLYKPENHFCFGETYNHSIAVIINKLSLTYFFILMTTHFNSKHHSKYTMCDTRNQCGSIKKHYHKFTSQLTRKMLFETII
jgi:hypothetical protein